MTPALSSPRRRSPARKLPGLRPRRFHFVFGGRVEAKVRAAFVRLLEQEISKATHELAIARAASDRVDTPAVFAAEAALLQARQILQGER